MRIITRTLCLLAPMLVALAGAPAAQAFSAGPAPVPCHSIGGGKYDCTFWPAGNGISGGAPVQAPNGSRVGYLNEGTNFVICQRVGSTVTSGGFKNHWWAYTEANDRRYGWVSALYGHGGDNYGAFASVPGCTSQGYPPGGAPAPPVTKPPAPPSGPSKVPCSSIGGGKYSCSWYVPGDGSSGGSPVEASTARTVGYLHQGANWIICQQAGAERSSGAYHNKWYGWTEADNGRSGWANALYANGGANDGQFSSAPACNGAHGATPSRATPAPTSSPPPVQSPPIPGGGSLSSIRQNIVSHALKQDHYDPNRDGCNRYGAGLICRGDPYYGEWCSVFATWAWRQAQVQIPIFGYSGDPYFWAGPGGGRDNIAGHHTYVLSPTQTPRPGDMVFFGSTSYSAHVAMILQVLPSHALVVMNGNDDDGYHSSGGIALKSTFFPSATHSVDGAGPVYAYASPVNDQPHSASVRASAATRAAVARALSPAEDQIKRQDPRAPARVARRRARRHPAFQAMPYVSRQITIEVADYLHSGKLVLEVFHSGSRAAAAHAYKRFLARHHDDGRSYIAHYEKRR